MNIQTQIGSNVAIWGVVLYLIHKVQLATELAARKSFLRLLDKNRELMRAEEDNRALADDNRELEADNERIRKEVAVSGMNEMQVQLVQVRAPRSFNCVFLQCCTVLHIPHHCAHLTFNNRQTRQTSTGTSVQS